MTNLDDWRIDHSGIGVADVAASARFYDAVLGALSLQPLVRISTAKTPFAERDDLGGVGYGASFPIFWIDCFHLAGVHQHTAFRARSRDEVDAFHAAALAAGGKDNDPPGLRTRGYPPGYYAAFVLDPDGNNIEAVFRDG
ncbi:VOC family protein [Sphingomonas asaccharolytica]|uniref:VOC family protein n=1 Tax=Sphingomonas asaccharolytica TaxID=40681 RepID=UPI00083429FB|nr:VOC family protein [Sphingomonas asaccharolytica]